MESSYKLPIQKIILASIYSLWVNRTYYSKVLAIPTLLLTLVLAFKYIAPIGEIKGLVLWVFLLINSFVYSIFAVTCHRLILTNDFLSPFNFKFYLTKRVIGFLAWFIVIYFLVTVINIIPMTIAINNEYFSHLYKNDELSYWVSLPIYIPGAYILARVCLVFPAKAVDEEANMKWSWGVTKNNGWRIFIIVTFYPWLLSIIIWLLWREEASILEDVILELFCFITLAIEIFALSFTYKELVKYN